jgi:hypothetical protein
MDEIDNKTEKKESNSASDEIDTNRTSYGTCTICLDPLYQKERRTFLPCSHQYHYACISPWLKNQTVCPICKVSIYVHIDMKDPEKIPVEYMNPADSRTMFEVMRERQEQQDILNQAGGDGLGGSQPLQGFVHGIGGSQTDQVLAGMIGTVGDYQLSSEIDPTALLVNLLGVLDNIYINQNNSEEDENGVPDSNNIE